MDDYLATLRREFASEPGSFLYQLRVDMTWDKAAFAQMTDAMQACCVAHTSPATASEAGALDESPLPRWLAELFWSNSFFVRSWTTPPNWPTPSPEEKAYFMAAYDQLTELAAWFFRGTPPRRSRGRM